jgi:ribosomal protein L14E/L6E/L27E
MTITPEEFIAHVGVKGMRWGVRKSRATVKPSSDYKKTAPLRKKKPAELTNKQLEAANKRANLEKNFSQLNPKELSKARLTAKKTKVVIAEVLAAAGTATAAYNFYHSKAGQAAIKAVGETLKKKGGLPSAVATTGWY